MKRKLLSNRLLKQTVLAVPAAALMLGASQAAQVGINFQDNWGGTPYAPLTEPSAFGIPLASWYNAPSVFDSGQTAFSTSGAFTLPSGGELKLAWSAKNTYSIYAAIPTTPGEDQVIYGYLDDTDYGYSVTLTGFRAFASSFTITTIASTDDGAAAGFVDAVLTTTGVTNNLQYLNNSPVSFGNGLWGTSTVSSVVTTLTGGNTVQLKGLPKADSKRSTLAAILIEYTPGGSNPPLIEQNPQAPPPPLFAGDPFTLNALASGTPPLAYQWRKGGVSVPNATDASFSRSVAVAEDAGNYDVVVTNASGAITSAVAAVTVVPVVQPQITQLPISQSFYVGYPATFSVAASGGKLSYLWKKDTQTIPNATNASLTLPSITSNDQGTYTVEVSNPVGPTASASATLTVKTPAGAYESVVVQTKPLLWFRYGETSILPDPALNSGSLGAAGDGVYVGSAVHGDAGALVGDAATAATLSGGKVTVPYNASLNPSGAFTVECWIKPAAAGTGLIVQSMINGENPSNTNDRNGWALRQNSTGLRFLVGTDLGAPFYYYYTTADGLLTAGVWHHVAVVYDGTAPTLYVNGVLAATTVTRQDGVAITPEEIALIRIVPNTAAPIIVGDRGLGGWTFSGSVDELGIYGAALPASALLTRYQNGTNAARTTPYATLVGSDSPLEYLRFNEPAYPGSAVNSGTLGKAWAGKHNGGAVANQVGPRPPTQPGLETDNLSVGMNPGFVSAPTLPLNVNTVTVTCWMKRAEAFTTGDLSWPAWLGDGGMHLNDDTSPTPGELRYHWKGGQWGWGSGLFVPAEVWTFCAMVVEPTKATFYMSDGTTLKSAVNTATHAALAISSPPGFGGNQPGSPGRNFYGQLDETTVYNRALSQSEINALFMVGTGAKLGLTLTPGGVIKDVKPAGTPHHGYNYGTTWTTASTDAATTPRTRSGVQQFSTAVSSQIRIPADADFNSTTGTISFWMRFNGNVAGIPGPGAEAAMLMDRRTGSGTVITLNDAGAIFVQCSGGANSFSAGYLPDDLWHHVAVTYDQSASGLVAIYIDGALAASNPNTAAWAWPATQQIELGRSHDGYWKRYDGLMDDFRIYSRVLTEAEIGQVYASDALVDTAALKLRYDFGTPGIGYTITWPFGTLESAPTLNTGATWTPVSTSSPYPFLPTEPNLFFRAKP